MASATLLHFKQFTKVRQRLDEIEFVWNARLASPPSSPPSPGAAGSLASFSTDNPSNPFPEGFRLDD